MYRVLYGKFGETANYGASFVKIKVIIKMQLQRLSTINRRICEKKAENSSIQFQHRLIFM